MHTIRTLQPHESLPLSLLLLANPSVALIEADLEQGQCHLLHDATGALVGAAILQCVGTDTLELKAIAIAPERQGLGWGKRFLAALIEAARAQNAHTLFVGTANSSLNQLGFYQKSGFRLSHILPNYFLDHYPEPIFEQGLQALDMVYLKRSLR
ncbi:MAG: GNAT family N-acetyltransferase [Neisseriaceae bacterium]|nr:GNAT family N-acetyltransferase [Neisseriaceae bacterium]MBP6862966.1 GNAT family N-acetyltransferase [Neisseriaceae bacterium]